MTIHKRSFQPPPVKAQPEPGAGFRMQKFPKPIVRSPTPSEQLEQGERLPPEATFEGPQQGPGFDSLLSPGAEGFASSIEAGLVGEDLEPPVLIEITKIRKSRYQNRRKIDESYVADLAENVRTDKLNNPIVVRPLPDGTYELVTGEHRVEAYLLNGETRIPARVRHLDDRQAVRAVVLDNHFHRPPHDYERYVGYKMLLDADAVTSRRALASLVGYTHTQINRLMAYGDLPEEAKVILEDHPGVIGGNLAEALAKHCDSAFGREAVVEAVRKIAATELTTARALSWVQGKLGTRTSKSSRVLTSAKGKPFCTLARDGHSIKIKVANGEDCAALEEAVFEVLRSRANPALTADPAAEVEGAIQT